MMKEPKTCHLSNNRSNKPGNLYSHTKFTTLINHVKEICKISCKQFRFPKLWVVRVGMFHYDIAALSCNM
jgi:hypothetical protein